MQGGSALPLVQFLVEPRFQRGGAGKLLLVDDMPVQVGQEVEVVLAPFLTDGASIPKWIEWLLVVFIGHQYAPSILRAATFHDWCCRKRHWWGSKRVHLLFYQAALADGVAPPRAWLFGKAVLYFGPRWAARNP